MRGGVIGPGRCNAGGSASIAIPASRQAATNASRATAIGAWRRSAARHFSQARRYRTPWRSGHSFSRKSRVSFTLPKVRLRPLDRRTCRGAEKEMSASIEILPSIAIWRISIWISLPRFQEHGDPNRRPMRLHSRLCRARPLETLFCVVFDPAHKRLIKLRTWIA